MSPTPTEVSASTIRPAATATGCHLLRIRDYKRIKETHGTGKCVESSNFAAAGRTWSIAFFPNGNTQDDDGFVSLFLELVGGSGDGDGDGDGERVSTDVRFSLLRRDGEPELTLFSRMYTRVFSKGVSSGFPKFIPGENLERWFLRGDCCTILCEIDVARTIVADEPAAKAVRQLERLGVLCNCKDDLCMGRHAAMEGNL